MIRLLLSASLLLAEIPASRSPLTFPRDHASHPDASLEWWYWTGHLQDRAGRAYGFQLTFFRVRDLHLAHFAWTDVARGTFTYEEKAHLALPGIASADENGLRLVNEDWSAEQSGGVWKLEASGRALALELELTPSKPPVLHGDEGLSRKGSGSQEYSHYVSITRFAVAGTLRQGPRSLALSGQAWFDHEWGPGALPAGAVGWDWFAVQLSDGSELMLYRIRDAKGGASSFSSGTWIPASGPAEPVRWEQVRFRETRRWTSPRTQASYPAGWEIAVPRLGLSLTIDPLVAAQELVTEESTGVTYWEGACRVAGSRDGRTITGRAYAELTGYAGKDVPGMAVASPSPPLLRESAPLTGRTGGRLALRARPTA